VTGKKIGIAILKEALCNTPALKRLDTSEYSRQLVVGVHAKLHGLGEEGGWVGGLIILVIGQNDNLYLCRYEVRPAPTAHMTYPLETHQCCEAITALKQVCNYLHGIRFHAKANASTLMDQLHLPRNDLPGALVTEWIACI